MATRPIAVSRSDKSKAHAQINATKRRTCRLSVGSRLRMGH